MADKKLKVTLVKSTIGAVPKNKKTIEALGLNKFCLLYTSPSPRDRG